MSAYVHSPGGEGRVAPLAHPAHGHAPVPPLPLAEVRRLLTAAAAVLVIAEEDGLGVRRLLPSHLCVAPTGEVALDGLAPEVRTPPRQLADLGRALLGAPLPRAWEALDDPLLCADLLGAWTLLRHADLDDEAPTLPSHPTSAADATVSGGSATLTWEAAPSHPTLPTPGATWPAHPEPADLLGWLWLAVATVAAAGGAVALGAAVAYSRALGGAG